MSNKLKLFKKIYRLTPLCFLPDGRLLAYRFGRLYFLNITDYKIIDSIQVTYKFKEIFISAIPIFHRLFRIGIRIAFPVDSERVIIFFDKKIFEFNLEKKTLSIGYCPEQGVRPLKISQINNLFSFSDMIVFGGYLGNKIKNPVHIYKRVAQDKWEVVFTFPKGEINHIHNIIPDKFNNCVWIFTGDFDNSAGIWVAKDNFKVVEPILLGKQKYRGCIGYPTKDGLLYATDTPFEPNSIRLLKNNNGKWTSEKIHEINGSCIYGCEFSDGRFVFSTTVEGDGRNQTLKTFLFNKKRGDGIKDNNAYIYIGNISEGFKEIYHAKKDFLPFSFQFGTFIFPEGINSTNYLPFYQVALKKGDLSMKVIQVNQS